jgi:hypothetical protein
LRKKKHLYAQKSEKKTSMRPFDHLPENETQKERQASHPGMYPAQPDQNQERPRDSALSSENTRTWMRWEYSPEEWALFERVDWRPVNLRFWLLACLSLLFLPDIGLLILSSTSGTYPLMALSIVLIFVWIPILILFAISIDIYGEARKRHRIRQQEKHAYKVTFDSKGVWEAGVYFPLNDLLFSLDKVSMTSKPPVIHFSQTRYSGKRTTPHSYPLHIPVPGGHEQEAADLVQRFRTEVIQAREQAWQLQTNPPEPDERGL